MGTTSDKKILAQIRKNVNNIKWECICKECNDIAINSHLIQRNGILKNLVENGHLYEVKQKDFFRFERSSAPYEFKRVGVGQAISHPIFCNNHDTNLFIDIEKTIPDLSDYKSQLLFSYRVVCAELRKKEIEKEYFTRISKSKSFSSNDFIDVSKNMIEGYSYGIKDLSLFQQQIEEELENTSDNFIFKYYKFPLLEVYASSTFSFQERISDPDKIREIEVFHGGFIHVLPFNNFTNILIGYNKKYANQKMIEYILSWENIDNLEFGRKLTELFCARIEGWGLSPRLYNKLSNNQIHNTINIMHENMMVNDFDVYVDYNLFGDFMK